MIIKICGITEIEDAQSALAAGADWIGLNLLAGPRRIDLDQARAILSALKDPSRVVALLSLEPIEAFFGVFNALAGVGLRMVQHYGRATPVTITRIGNRGAKLIHVRHLNGAEDLDGLDEWLTRCGDRRPPYVLIDAGKVKPRHPALSRHGETDASGMPLSELGGTGRTANWELLAAARAAGRFTRWPKLLLAGGLTPSNVAEAIARVQPAGVDVSSGVEASPGKKDPAKVAAFVEAVRASTR